MALKLQSPIARSKRSIAEDELLVFSEIDRTLTLAGQGPNGVGTTYTANGTQVPDSNATVELGSAVGGLTPEVIPQFASRAQAIRTYDYMANNDAAIDVSLRAAKMPIMGATFFIQPASDSPEDVLAAQFVDANLLGGISSPLLSVLEDILRMYEHGFSVVEKVYEERVWAPPVPNANRKMYTMLKKLAPRPTPTLGRWYYDDNGGPLYVEHSAYRADFTLDRVNLPIDKLIVFSHNKRGGNLEGRSLLRTAHKHWFYKDTLYTIDGIQKERHGTGFPTIKLPPNYTPADLAAAKVLIKNIRTNHESGAILPPGWELLFAEMKGQPVDVMKSVDHHNGMILLNIMLQFLTSGVTNASSGGRATAGSAQDMFTKSLRYVGNLICSMFNLYCIPQLVGYNFKVLQMPQMRVRNIGETKDLQQWASALANLAARGLITLDADVENWVREVIDAPYRTASTPVVGKFISQGGFNTKGGGSGKGGTNEKNGTGRPGAATDNANG